MVLVMSQSRHDSLDAASDYLFDQYDIDGDGFLNQFDFCLFLWDLKHNSERPLSKEQALKCWTAVDRYNVGRINQEEFRKGMVILWEHDFFVENIPDLRDVEDDTALDTDVSTSVSHSREPSSESIVHSREPSTTSTAGSPTPSADTYLTTNPLAAVRRNKSDSSDQRRLHSKYPRVKRDGTFPTSTSVTTVEDLIKRLASSEILIKQEEDDVSPSTTADDSDNDDDLLVPRSKHNGEEVVSVKRIPATVQRLVRVYMDGESYKTFALYINSTATDLLKMIYEKMETPSWEEGRYALYESDINIHPTEFRPLKSKELISDIENKGNKKIYFKEVASVSRAASPSTPTSKEPPRDALKTSGRTRSKLFGFLNK